MWRIVRPGLIRHTTLPRHMPVCHASGVVHPAADHAPPSTLSPEPGEPPVCPNHSDPARLASASAISESAVGLKETVAKDSRIALHLSGAVELVSPAAKFPYPEHPFVSNVLLRRDPLCCSRASQSVYVCTTIVKPLSWARRT